MKIPAKIELQLIDEFGKPFAKENLLFKFKITHSFMDDELFEEGEEPWNQCILGTDNFGKIYLDQKNIINELQLYDIHDLEKYVPKKIIIENCDKQALEELKKNRRFIQMSRENIEESYLTNNMQHMKLEDYVESISQIIKQNNSFVMLLDNSENYRFEIKPNSIEDIWNDESEVYYQFLIHETAVNSG